MNVFRVIFLGLTLLPVLFKCKGESTTAQAKGVAFRLADGSSISQSSSDEYNPYVVKMSDGYLVLVFGSDRSCGACTTGTHNIFISRSTTAYSGSGSLPYFNAPAVLNVAGTPINQASAISFAAGASAYGLRIFYNTSAGVLRYADLTPTASSFDASNGGSSITNSAWNTATIVGISDSGAQLIAKTSAGVYVFDPFALNPSLTAMGSIGTSVQSVAQVSSAYTGLADSYLTLSGGSFVAASFSGTGAGISTLNTAASIAKVSLKAASIMQSGAQSGDFIVASGIESGASKQDLFIFDGTTAAGTWSAVTAKPASTGIPAGGAAGTISTTATRVYGQAGSFTSATLNNGGLSSQSLNRPIQPMIADGGLYVADQINNRGLFYSGVSTTATRVYCQNGSFTSATFNVAPSAVQCRGEAANGNVSGIFADNTGVYVVDIGAHRIPFHPGSLIDASTGRIYGQNGNFTTFTQDNPSRAAGGLFNPDRVVTDATGVYISDTFNHRVLHFPGTATTPDRVYGQNGSFTANTASSSATGFNGPRGLWADADGLYVADYGNNRVLFFPGTSTTATRVYGQFGSFTANTANNGGTSANSLNGPWSVRPYAGGVFIADFSNHRVLYYAGTSTTATQVWGQGGSFTTNAANNGGLSASSLNSPLGIDVDATGLYIADNLNHRVLFFPRQ